MTDNNENTDKNDEKSPYNKVVVAGGGTLGSQIAYMSALHGKDTTILDISPEAVEQAKKRVQEWEKEVKHDTNATDAQLENAKKHLHYSDSMPEALKGADLVIEALPEVPKIKTDFYHNFAKNADPKTVLASNSSTLLPSTFAKDTGRPDKFLAYHFSNGIWKRNTAEIIPQKDTAKGLPQTLEKFSREIGMIPIMVKKEQSGYVLNSLLVPWLQDALRLWGKGVADPKTIDKVWMLDTSSKEGPFATLDMIGLRTGQKLADDPNDPAMKKVRENFKKMMDEGHIGKESGQGFYKYPNPTYQQSDFLK